MNRFLLIGFAFGAAVLGGCGKETARETAGTADSGTVMIPASASSPLASARGALSASAGPEAEDEPPTERRAERKAVNEINHANYKSEMSKIEKELGSP